MSNYLPECGLIYSLFSKDLMIPSQWHFLRKVCSSDPRRHPGPAGNATPGGWEGNGWGEKGAPNGYVFQGNGRQNRTHCLLCLRLAPECPIEPVRRNRVYKVQAELCPRVPLSAFAWAARAVVFMRMQCANLMHVIASPFSVWPKLLNNQQINFRKISFGLRGKPILFSLNRGLKPYVRDQRF